MARLSAQRVLRATAGAALSLSLLAGCGGSDIDQAGPSAVLTEESDTSATTGPVAAGADAVVEVPDAPPVGAGREGGPPEEAKRISGADADVVTPAGSTEGARTKTADKTTKGAEGGGAAPSGTALQRLVAAHPLFGGDAPCKPATLSEVPIGNVSTLSGVLGELFSPVVNALNVFTASVNACGGLNGHKIKLYFDDDQGDPSTASTKIQSMIQSKKILAFVGNIQVLTIDAVAPIIKRAGIPIIGSDVTNDTWMTNPLMFPQAAPPGSIAYGFLLGATQYFKVKNLGVLYCVEVPRSCRNNATAFQELAPKMGAVLKVSTQVSLTQPSFVQQCLEMKNAGVEALGLIMDAASMKRIARSCEQVNYYPKVMGHPLGVGNEKQFLGSKWLGNAYVPLNAFGWMANSTAAEKYYQDMVRKYDPGFDTGGAASLGWAAGALLLAASSGLSPENPSTQQLLETLWQFKGQKFTELGGLAGPRTFGKDVNPKVPYCLFAAVSKDDGSGWKSVTSKPTCTDLLAPSDPQAQG